MLPLCFFFPFQTSPHSRVFWLILRNMILRPVNTASNRIERGGVGKKVQWLRALTVLSEDSGSILSPNLEAHNGFQLQFQVTLKGSRPEQGKQGTHKFRFFPLAKNHLDYIPKASPWGLLSYLAIDSLLRQSTKVQQSIIWLTCSIRLPTHPT